MKKLLSKGLSVLVGVSMMFGANVALAVPAPQIEICHIPPGNPENAHTILINSNAWSAHQNHGDTQGPCSEEENGEPQPLACDENIGLINGDFEMPTVTNGSGWELFADGTPDLGWSVSWVSPNGDAPSTANLELHGGVNGWLPNDGSQYAELDTDYGSPAGGAASVRISQDINTVVGATYEISYAFSPRPDTDASNNVLKVFIDGSEVDAQGPVAGGGSNSWTTYMVSFEAENATTEIAFADEGTPDSYGTFLDSVSVNCVDEPVDPEDPEEPEEPSCDSEEIWARVVVTDFSNQENGDVTDTIYLGSGSNTVTSGEWFKLSELDANDIDSFADVPGLAVQRKSGEIVLELHGSQNSEDQEYVDGYIEFFNGLPTSVTSAPDQDKLEYSGSFHNDNAWMNGDKVYFDLAVNTADDRFSAEYEYSVDESCIDGPSCDSQTIWARVVVTSFSNNGAGNLTDTIYLGSNVNTVANGEWFSLVGYDVNNIGSFADVPGLAVRRRNDNKIVLELHGSHLPQGVGQEYADGYIEFFHGVPTALVGASGQDRLEDSNYPHEDLVWINGDKAYFNLAVGTEDDRFSTTYIYSLDEECDEDPEDQQCLTDCIPPEEPTCEELQNCESECSEDCDEGDGGDEEDSGPTEQIVNIPTPTRTSSGSAGGGGQVLGATDDGEVLGACDAFTMYHRFGDRGGEVSRIQEFLNEEMNAGLKVDGVFGLGTVKAVKAFQQKYFDQVIVPWHPPYPLRVTGKVLQTTRMMMNEIIGCPETEVYLPEPNIMYKINWVKPQ